MNPLDNRHPLRNKSVRSGAVLGGVLEPPSPRLPPLPFNLLTVTNTTPNQTVSAPPCGGAPMLCYRRINQQQTDKHTVTHSLTLVRSRGLPRPRTPARGLRPRLLRRGAAWLGLRPALYFRPRASVLVTPTMRVGGAPARGSELRGPLGPAPVGRAAVGPAPPLAPAPPHRLPKAVSARGSAPRGLVCRLPPAH